MTHIPGYKGRYTISKGGYIENKFNKEMKQSTNPQGYKTVSLIDVHGKRNHCRVHRLVALTYLQTPTPGQDQVNHIDGDKANNSIQNLEWCNQWDNMNHAKRMGFIKSGDERSDKQKAQAKVNGSKQGKRNRKVTPELAAKMQELYDSGMVLANVGIATGFSLSCVSKNIKNVRSEAGRFTKRSMP